MRGSLPVSKLTMSLKFSAFVGAACLLGMCARTAVGQEPSADSIPERADDAPLLVFEPALARRLIQAETAHRQAREAGMKDPKTWAEQRAPRAARRRAEIAEVWGAVVDGPDGQARLRIHADRMARLNRMLDLAQQARDNALIERVQNDVQKALVDHARDMQTLRAALGLK